ncbi:MAG: hypothetical protein HOP07_12455 [Bacteriovoracaceae bacterium]|nr:hypothetical protein [Bacteriovoracaceae bacterium]
MKVDQKVEIIGKYGASLSLIELGLGSFLHAFHIPFSGVFLSLNQGYILCRAALIGKKENLHHGRFLPYTVSNIAAFLKSLSPAGKKLGPMLSLSMQGLLFSLGTSIFGVNSIGLIIGMIFLSLWSFVQPILTYYLFFGNNLLEAADFLFKKSLPFHGLEYSDLINIFLFVIILKLTLAVLLAIVALRRLDDNLYSQKIETELLKMAQQKKSTQEISPLLGSVKDLMRPLFLCSLAITGLFIYLSENNFGKTAWYLMRPIAVGLVFFYVSRTLTLDRYLFKLLGGPLDGFGKGCLTALNKVRTYI